MTACRAISSARIYEIASSLKPQRNLIGATVLQKNSKGRTESRRRSKPPRARLPRSLRDDGGQRKKFCLTIGVHPNYCAQIVPTVFEWTNFMGSITSCFQ